MFPKRSGLRAGSVLTGLILCFGSRLIAQQPPTKVVPKTPVQLFPLSSVRLLDGPFTAAVDANRTYLLALDPDRLLAPFRREAGLEPRKPSYGNWESSGLDGHTAGHYLSALADMIASGNDTKDGQLQRRLNHMIDELAACQEAFGDGYIGGVPGSRELWGEVAAGHIQTTGFGVNDRWVPWYNLHKTFAGLRDAWLETGNAKARDLLIRFGDWCEKVTSKLSDEQMQAMLNAEYGGMNEVLADLYAITGDKKYLTLAQRFNHKAILDPLIAHRDELNGRHANTQIPKVIGLERIATLTNDKQADSGARFFWNDVTHDRTIAFGGNSVAEHFNDPHDFRGTLESREGPESCNTYNMLRLTEQLFASEPQASHVDFYERALFNHLLSAIHPDPHPGYVYFTPIRPEHYRVYSQPDQCFWCCVGTGMENPGRYGQFIYARSREGIYVNLFIASELTVADAGLTLRQDTSFPDQERTKLTMKLARPLSCTLFLRHPAWVAAGALSVKVNGEPVALQSTPSSYAAIRREWKDGDTVEVEIPMTTTVEQLPDGSDWYAILRGPIVLVHPSGTQDLVGLRADDTRMGHVAHGPLIPLDQAPALFGTASEVPSHVKPDPMAGPMTFRLSDIVDQASTGGLKLIPFFRLHDSRYQMYWQLTSKEQLPARKAALAAAEKARAEREAATIDSVAVGEQQPEVEHDFKGNGTKTGFHEGRRWRNGQMLQYTFNTRGEKAANLVVTYWGGDNDSTFDIFANGTLLTTERLRNQRPGEFIEKRYPIPPGVLSSATNNRMSIRFVAKQGVAGGLFEVRLMRP